MTRITPNDSTFEGTNSYTLSGLYNNNNDNNNYYYKGDCKFAIHQYSSPEVPTVTTIISLPFHSQVIIIIIIVIIVNFDVVVVVIVIIVIVT